MQEGWAVKGVSHDGAPKQQHQYTTEQREFLTEKYDNAGGHKLLLADVHEDTKRKFCEKPRSSLGFDQSVVDAKEKDRKVLSRLQQQSLSEL